MVLTEHDDEPVAGPGPSSLAHAQAERDTDADSSASSSDSDSDSGSDSESDSEPEITKDYLDALLDKARQNMRAQKIKISASSTFEAGEDLIRIAEDELDALANTPLPALDPGKLPAPYITTSTSAVRSPSPDRRTKRKRRAIDTVVKLNDPEAERTAALAQILAGAPAPPAPPPELDPKTGRKLTKKERKALKADTAGASWFDLPAPPTSELPRLHREVEALRLRNNLDPKRFYRKEEGEGKGIQGLPKYFAIGTVLPESTPFQTGSSANLARSARKRTLVDELVDDAEARTYAKKKFRDLQGVRGARGRGTLRAKQALRKGKW